MRLNLMRIKILIVISAIGVLLLSGCVAEAPEKAQPVTAPTQILAKMKIEVTSSTWREGKDPYDIHWALKGKLEKVGFEVMPSGSTTYDVMLLIDYKEEKNGWYMGGGYGTDIKCNLKLQDRNNSVLFEKEIVASTPEQVEYYEKPGQERSEQEFHGLLYQRALDRFTWNVYFEYCGEIIASKYVYGDEISVLLSELKDQDSLVRKKAAEGLGKLGNTAAVGPLIQILQDESSWVRKEAAIALGKLKDPKAAESLTALLNDKDKEVRRETARALGQLGNPIAVEPLIQALRDKEGPIRSATVEALGNIGDPRAVGPLIGILRDKGEEGYVQTSAVAALIKIGTAAVEPLIDALQDKNSWVRMKSAQALGEIGDKRAIEPLIAALDDKDATVRASAQQALEKIR